MTKLLIAAIALALLAIVGAGMVNAGLESAGDQQTVAAEQWTPTAGSVTALNESNRQDVVYDQYADVRDENGTASTEGTDYQWYESNGTVKALSGGNLDGDSSAEIDYQYSVLTRMQQNLAGIFASGVDVVGVLVLVLTVAAILGGASKLLGV